MTKTLPPREELIAVNLGKIEFFFFFISCHLDIILIIFLVLYIRNLGQESHTTTYCR